MEINTLLFFATLFCITDQLPHLELIPLAWSERYEWWNMQQDCILSTEFPNPLRSQHPLAIVENDPVCLCKGNYQWWVFTHYNYDDTYYLCDLDSLNGFYGNRLLLACWTHLDSFFIIKRIAVAPSALYGTQSLPFSLITYAHLFKQAQSDLRCNHDPYRWKPPLYNYHKKGICKKFDGICKKQKHLAPFFKRHKKGHR